jgi:hypothetical protein
MIAELYSVLSVELWKTLCFQARSEIRTSRGTSPDTTSTSLGIAIHVPGIATLSVVKILWVFAFRNKAGLDLPELGLMTFVTPGA